MFWCAGRRCVASPSAAPMSARLRGACRPRAGTSVARWRGVELCCGGIATGEIIAVHKHWRLYTLQIRSEFKA